MIYKLLPIALLLAINCAHAQTTITLANATEPYGIDAIQNSPENNNTEEPSGIVTEIPAIHPRYSGDGGVKVYAFYAIDLGYAHANTTTELTNTTGTIGKSSLAGGGFMYGGEIGAKIFFLGHSTNTVGILSISVYGTQFSINEKYKDALGVSKTNKLQFGVAALPVSYTRMSYGRNEEGAGYYWQAGVNLDYISKVTENDKVVTSHYNSIYFEPCLSGGLSTPFRLRDIKRHKDMGGGRALVGPFITYAVTNMAKDSGVTMNGYRVGIKWTYIFM